VEAAGFMMGAMHVLRKAIVAVGLPIVVVAGLAAPAMAKPTSCHTRFSNSVRDEALRFNPTNDASVDRFGPVIGRANDVLLRCLTESVC
jgi:hypothetical protein